MKRFIFITRYFYPSFTGIPRMVSEIAFSLAEKNYVVKILTSREGYENTLQNLPSKEKMHGVDVTRLFAFPFKRTHILGRIMNYLGFYVACLFRLFLLLKPGDTLIVLSEPPLIATLVTPLAKIRRAKLINWIQDIHPEISGHLGFSFANGSMGKGLTLFRNIAWKKAEMNIVIGKRMATFVETHGVSRKNIALYPNWEDGKVIYPLQKSVLRDSWGYTEKFIIGYSGNLGRAHDFKTLIETATQLANHNTENEIIFLIIGDGYHKKYLIQEIATRQLKNVILKPYQPRDILRDSLNIPDIHLISAIPEVEGLLVPGKLTSAMAVGRPILFVGDTQGEVAQILREANCGESISIGNSTALMLAILKLKNNPALQKQWGENARSFFSTHFDKSIAMNKLCDFFLQEEIIECP